MTSIGKSALRNVFEDWPVLITIQFNCISNWDVKLEVVRWLSRLCMAMGHREVTSDFM